MDSQINGKVNAAIAVGYIQKEALLKGVLDNQVRLSNLQSILAP